MWRAQPLVAPLPCEAAAADVCCSRLLTRDCGTHTQIYKGDRHKMPKLLAEVYQAFAVQQARHQALAVLRWANGILAMFGAPLSCARFLVAHSDESGAAGGRRGSRSGRGGKRGGRGRKVNLKDLYRDASNGIMFAYIAMFYGGNQQGDIDSRVLYVGTLWVAVVHS